MALRDIREQIAANVASVEGIGVVHQYRRLAKTWDKLLDLFKDEGRINAWMISRTKTPAKRDTMPTLERQHTFQLYGIYGLQDAEATEIEFQDIVERIQDKFDSNYDLNGTVLNSGPVQVLSVDTEVMGNVLCHTAILELEATERVTYS